MLSSQVFSQNKTLNTAEMNSLYVGTYTKKEAHVDGKGAGIYLLHQDPATGSLENMGAKAKLVNPSFVKTGRQGKYLFAVSELTGNDANTGFLYSYRIQENGDLEEVNRVESGGLAPCHVGLDRSGKYVFVSNYIGGVVGIYRVAENGLLELIEKLELPDAETAHVHSVKISGDNRTAYIADLGNDRVLVYHFDVATGKLEEQTIIDLPEGSGPRHFSVTRNGNYAYVVNELNSTITGFKILKNGMLEIIEHVSTLPDNYLYKNAAADIHINQEGTFLYVSNRGHDSIGVFSIDAVSGELENVDYAPVAGKTPRNFAISPFGKYLYAASQDTGNVTSFLINPDTGKLRIQEPVFKIPTPVSLEFRR